MSVFKKIKDITKNIFPSQQKNEMTEDARLKEKVAAEIDDLLKKIEKAKAENENSEKECKDLISKSLGNLQKEFTKEQLENAYVWSRYIKIAIHAAEEPVISELAEYADENNYKKLSKRLLDLMQHYIKKGDEEKIKKLEKISNDFYLHIIDKIDSGDVASYLEIGKIYQKNKEYEKARIWFSKITETDKPFKGVTSLIASYVTEVREILKEKHLDYESGKKIDELNSIQNSIYEKWIGIMEQNINFCVTTEKYKKDYITLVTGYARFQRNVGNYDYAFNILSKIPEDYPDIYRVYTEKAMLYQFKPYNNPYYSLEKAIDAFQTANEVIPEDEGVKSKKSILVPLANAYYQSGIYDKAVNVCNCVLELDKNEKNAIELKNRILSPAS